MSQADAAASPKTTPLAADISTEAGRTKIEEAVDRICGAHGATTTSSTTQHAKQLRYLVHYAGIIDPIKSIRDVTPDELRHAMVVNCEGPLFLNTALFPYMKPVVEGEASGRILHVSSGAAHNAPPVGWGCYGISKAAFIQSARVLQREFEGHGVLVSSFKPGVVDTPMQKKVRTAPKDDMPSVSNFVTMQEKAGTETETARRPVAGGLDTPSKAPFLSNIC